MHLIQKRSDSEENVISNVKDNLASFFQKAEEKRIKKLDLR